MLGEVFIALGRRVWVKGRGVGRVGRRVERLCICITS